MRKNRLPICMLCMVIIAFCCSCGFFGDQRYLCEMDKVESVQIVRLDQYIEGECRYEYTVLSQISDHAAFIDRLNALKHSVNWGDPRQMDVQYVVIKIDYRNGDFDMIHPDAQCFNRSGVAQYGFFFFDDEQFNTLIADFMKE